MAKFLVLHTIDLRTADAAEYSTEAQMAKVNDSLAAYTAETYCIASWVAAGAGKIACLWEAPSEQAIIDVFAKMPQKSQVPTDGIYPAMVIDWREMKK